MRFVIEYLPSILRTNIIDLIYVLLQGVRDTWFRFGEHIKETDKILSYNSQYPNLQRLLNELYDSTDRHIKVYDGAASDSFLLAYPNAELKPIEIGFVVVKSMSKYHDYNGFTVELPAGFEGNNDLINKIKRTVEDYKFASVKYEIIFSN
jgi:hypothetical protein